MGDPTIITKIFFLQIQPAISTTTIWFYLKGKMFWKVCPVRQIFLGNVLGQEFFVKNCFTLPLHKGIVFLTKK
ncbi:MAG: hypothetical protein AAFZ15_00800 [Bacteroidota bacterium]